MKTQIKLLVLLAVMLISPVLQGQEIYKTVPAQSKVIIKGTSTLHDWQMDARSFKSEMVWDGSEKADLRISYVSFVCKPSDIRSEHKLMDNKAHEALKVKQFSEIKFHQSDVKIDPSPGSSFKGRLIGKLEIAGVSRNIELPFTGEIKSKETVSVSGSFKMKMSDFGITPPTAMMGTIKTGDEITLEYLFLMQSEKTLTTSK